MVTTALDNYLLKKQRLISTLEKIKQRDGALGLRKTTSNLFRNRHQATNRIDVREFNRVLQVDAVKMLVDVEGMTTFDDLTKATLKAHCLPTVVPELKSITIGGALAGVGIESSSFRYGLVHETVAEFDLLTSEGEVLLCRPDNEHKDLFFAFPNSYGSLGYALRVQIKLIAVKPFIELTHQRFNTMSAYFDNMRAVCARNRDDGEVDYVDGVVFDAKTYVLTSAKFVDQVPYQSDYTYMKVFYKSLLKNHVDYLSTYDYIWRWDADWFWCSRVFYMQNPLLRLLLGKWLLKSTAYWKIKKFMVNNPFAKKLVKCLEGKSEQVIQDVAIPADQAENYLTFFQDQIGITPVWTCPIHPYKNDVRFDLFTMDPNKLYINFGFWSTVASKQAPGYYNRLIEEKVLALGGNKSLYSDVFYSEEEFWKIYDKDFYFALKKKYDPHSRLKDIFSKCTDKQLL